MSNTEKAIKRLLAEDNIDEAYSLLKRNIKNETEALKESPEYCAAAASVFLNRQEYDTALNLISIGLTNDGDNYELYLLLGECYFPENINKALLCFYQAMFYCDMEDDRQIMDNSFFYLMLGLYSGEKIGTVGALTNNKDTEQSLIIDDSEVNYYARIINVPAKNVYEKKIWISDFAMLISRKAIDSVGLFDEAFSSCYLEDRDYCVRMLLAGYVHVLCYNSFVYCQCDEPEVYRIDDRLKERNQELLKKKWNCDINYSNAVRSALLAMIERDHDDAIEVLELGCAMGSNLARIRFDYPNSKVYGVEYDSDVVRIGRNVADIIQGDVENMTIPYSHKQFDYIICADVLEHLRNPEETIKRFMPYLKDDGFFLISLPNIRFYGVSMMLTLLGRFDYADSGILDRTHLRFFTRDTAIEMLEGCGLEVVRLERNYNHEELSQPFIDRLSDSFDVMDVEELKVFQYYFLAKKR